MERPHDRSYWVIEDRLLAAQYPGDAHTPEGRRPIDFLLARGFDCFLDLTPPQELEPYDALVTHRGGIHTRLPIVDMSVPSTLFYSRHPVPHCARIKESPR